MDNKILAVSLAVIGALGTIFGMVDPIKSLFPEPEVFYGLDTSQEIFDHSLSPNQIKFHLIHNGTDTFYIDTINIRSKLFESISCVDNIPSVEKSDMFDTLEITATGERARTDHFVTINGEQNLNMLYEEAKTGQLVIDYAIKDNFAGESFEFWHDVVIGYSELENREMKYAKYHAHYKQNPDLCQ